MNLLTTWKRRKRQAVGPDGTDLRDATLRFRVGDLVSPLWARSGNFTGVVVGVYPALWCVEVDWGLWREKISADELRPANKTQNPPIQTGASPSGAATELRKIATRVADRAFARLSPHLQQRSALYWAAPDRKYRATRGEVGEGCYSCPRCGKKLRRVTIRTKDRAHQKILACWGCEFLVDPTDILNDPASGKV